MKDVNGSIHADYLIVGAGATGMAFADSLITESNATIVMVDKHDAPGGHWNEAYPFLRLHGPSAFYGVNSQALGSEAVERSGYNAGFRERASAAEIRDYYDQLMRKQFLPTGRLQYFPMSEYRGDGKFVSLVSGAEYQVHARKTVDATFAATEVPLTHTRKYDVDPAIACIPPNGLPAIAHDYASYVIIGSGKTGMDACVWLLDRNVPPERIRWIMPRDSWLLDRAQTQPGNEFLQKRVGSIALQMELVCKAESIAHLFKLLHEAGALLRLDDTVVPSAYRCAIVSRSEFDALRQVKDVVRLGHVRRIDARRIVLDHGSVPTSSDALHIDCTATGIQQWQPPRRVFDGDLITLQMIRTCQPCFSAALIGHVEVAYADAAEKNRFCTPIPSPSRDVDWLRLQLINLANQQAWSRDPALRTWIAACRLDFNRANPYTLTADDQATMRRLRDSLAPAAARLKELLEQSQVPEPA